MEQHFGGTYSILTL